ncbi:fluoride efflux transporter FluC [Micromonospora sp. WMMA1923]|uniref:fluoride efflux transporter FluC n=1 Tax=Micromonospora sp. WMMA1923 TaxID=3404125 RepID=UPI003B92A962
MTGAPEPRIDPDVDLGQPDDRSVPPGPTAVLLAVIAAGGVLGALARAGAQAAAPNAATGFAWATFGVNVLGCLLIGVLMVLVERCRANPLLRPFLGVGVLGGFTSFSAYVLDVHRAAQAGAFGVAGGYLVATVLGALAAVWLGDVTTNALLDRRAAR